MTSTVRSVRVVMNADIAKYVADMRLAGAETRKAFDTNQVAGFNRELTTGQQKLTATNRALDTTSTKMRAVDTSSQRLTRSVRETNSQLDTMSGRMGLVAEALVTLGPGMVGLGAAAVPTIAGITAGLGAAAGAVGTLLLATNGLGDGLKALNAYELAPTADNLEAVRTEFAKLGPDGAHFVKFLDLQPKLEHLQQAARAGLLPGVQDGITNLLRLTPQVRSIVTDLASTLGSLASDAGASLAGPGFKAFFTYLQTDAAVVLQQMGRSVGDLGKGIADLIVDMAPLSRDFGAGLERTSAAFAKWAAGLDSTTGFQHFLDYVRTSGPQVTELLGDLAKTFADIVSAAAPVSTIVLPMLDDLVKVVDAVASSDLATPLIAGAAALTAWSRAQKLLTGAGETNFLATQFVKPLKEIPAALPSLQQAGQYFSFMGQSAANASAKTLEARQAVYGFGKSLAPIGKAGALVGALALSSSGAADKIGLSNTAALGLAGTLAGPYGAAVGAAIGLTEDMAAANQHVADNLRAATVAAQQALTPGSSMASQRSAYDTLQKQVDAASNSLHSFGYVARSAISLKPLTDFFFHGEKVDPLVEQITSAKQALGDLGLAMSQSGGIADLFGETIGMTGTQINLTTQDADALSHALSALNGFLSRRDALRNYQTSLATFRAALAAGAKSFDITTKAGRDNQAALDGVATAIEQTASQIKNTSKRADFLAGARQQLQDLAKGQAPAAQKAIRQVVRELDNLGLTHPTVDMSKANKALGGTKKKLDDLATSRPKVEVDADTTKADSAFTWLFSQGTKLSHTRPKITVDADTGQATAKVTNLVGLISSLHSKTITVTTKSTGYQPNVPLTKKADGGYITGPGTGTSDSIPAWLSNGEYVVNAAATARNRPLLEHINAQKFATGGQVATGPIAPGYMPLSLARPTTTSATKLTKTQLEQAAALAKANAELKHLSVNLKGIPKDVRKPLRDLLDGSALAGVSLKDLNKASKLLNKSLTDTKSQLSTVQGQRDSLQSAITSSLSRDLWTGPNGGTGNVWTQSTMSGWSPQYAISQLQGVTADAKEFDQLRQQVEKNGIKGTALNELESNGGLQALRAFAASPDLSRQYQQAYTAAFGNGTAKNPGAVGATVNAAGKDLYGKQIDHIHNQIEKLRGDVKDVTKAINDKKKADDASRARHTAAGAKATAKELNSTAKKAKTR